jgi:hypothetical protein
MSIKTIITKIKQTGRSNQKERNDLKRDLLKVIEFNDNFIETLSNTLIIKVEGTPIGGIYFNENENPTVKFYGNFKTIFENDSKYIGDLTAKLCGSYIEKTVDVNPEMEKLVKIQAQSQKQNGYGFEFALIEELNKQLLLNKINVKIEKDSAYETLAKNFYTINIDEQLIFTKVAKQSSLFLIEQEPNLTNHNDEIVLSANKDSAGKSGDVRDLIINKANGKWILGVSCKNNNESARHSRISPTLDFVKDWLKIESGASELYKDGVKSVFTELNTYNGMKWSDITFDKAKTCYEPLLNLFKNELTTHLNNEQNIENLITYVIGKQDYYKIIKDDKIQGIKVKGFNLFGSLNPIIKQTLLPKTIKDIKIENSNRLLVTFDNNWAISFRIHNASSSVENSFKFDVVIQQSPEIFNKQISL